MGQFGRIETGQSEGCDPAIRQALHGLVYRLILQQRAKEALPKLGVIIAARASAASTYRPATEFPA